MPHSRKTPTRRPLPPTVWHARRAPRPDRPPAPASLGRLRVAARARTAQGRPRGGKFPGAASRLVREKQRSELLHSRLMAVYGVWQCDMESGGEVRHLIPHRLVDLTPLLGGLATQRREFH